MYKRIWEGRQKTSGSECNSTATSNRKCCSRSRDLGKIAGSRSYSVGWRDAQYARGCSGSLGRVIIWPTPFSPPKFLIYCTYSNINEGPSSSAWVALGPNGVAATNDKKTPSILVVTMSDSHTVHNMTGTTTVNGSIPVECSISSEFQSAPITYISMAVIRLMCKIGRRRLVPRHLVVQHLGSGRDEFLPRYSPRFLRAIKQKAPYLAKRRPEDILLRKSAQQQTQRGFVWSAAAMMLGTANFAAARTSNQHVKNSSSDPPGIEPESPWWEAIVQCEWKVMNCCDCMSLCYRQGGSAQCTTTFANAKRNIDVANVANVFRLIIDERMLQNIIKCPETRILHNLQEEIGEALDSSIGLLYLFSVSRAKGFPLASLGLAKLSIRFYGDTMSTNLILYRTYGINLTATAIPATNQLLIFLLMSNFSQPKTNAASLNTCPENLINLNILNRFPYLEKDEIQLSALSASENVVLRLVDPYLDTGRNISMDYFFNSVILGEKLKVRDTIDVATVNRARRDIPTEVKNTHLPLQDSFVLKHNDFTLSVYQGKIHKNALVLITMHTSVAVGGDIERLPETISNYNSPKFGVKLADQKARRYSTKAASQHWPRQVFCNILDFAGINTWILFKEDTCSTICRDGCFAKRASNSLNRNITEDVSRSCDLKVLRTMSVRASAN
ncbi:hypothetical protein PR048_019445 [Dryococelus australis]|uniref:PiggyBac transposable element-derived protein domain-containing protein n=1 Tax=Dryococelus australis TaxID=614101 RepID=A0ABQ9H3U1_9NEOP|nr:hypothetical protein PR048_019445 [Dryococelus australis]